MHDSKKFKKIFRGMVTATALSALLLTGAAAANIGTAVVEGDTLFLRQTANGRSTILATAVKGDQVYITGDAVNGWYPVTYGNLSGYMSSNYLSVTLDGTSTNTAASASSSSTVYGRVTASPYLNLRASASTTGDKVGTASYGALVEILESSNGWYKIVYNGTTAYASADYITYNVDPTEQVATTGQQIVAKAAQYLGCRYSYGASGPSSFDCSGFTSYIYKQFGITLNRSAAGQTQNGTSVSRSELQPGDLVLFRHSGSSKAATHVGIYVGNGQFIHASTNDYQVRYDSLDSAYYSAIFIGGRHVVD
jgi:cell wall-associated NlpC family hydrolase